jgi:hypothetical protein
MPKKVQKKVPTEYNKFMKTEIKKLQKSHPAMTHQARFKKAASTWSSKK